MPSPTKKPDDSNVGNTNDVGIEPSEIAVENPVEKSPPKKEDSWTCTSESPSSFSNGVIMRFKNQLLFVKYVRYRGFVSLSKTSIDDSQEHENGNRRVDCFNKEAAEKNSEQAH